MTRKLLYPKMMFLLTLLLLCFSLFHSKEIASFFIDGIRLCIHTILPSLFPFMIFSDMLLASNVFSNIPDRIGKIFEKTFRIPRIGILPFFIGLLCGFPLGVKIACNLYENQKISKSECERLLCFCNNTGPGFLIAGVGILMRNSWKDGVLLYAVQCSAAIFIGFLLSIVESPVKNVLQNPVSFPRFSLVRSIQAATKNLLSICGIVTCFSVICKTIQLYSSASISSALIGSVLEIGNGAFLSAQISNRHLSLAITAFAVNFSGLSVHMQGKIFADESGISWKYCYTWKLLQGIFAYLLTGALSLLTSV